MNQPLSTNESKYFYSKPKSIFGLVILALMPIYGIYLSIVLPGASTIPDYGNANIMSNLIGITCLGILYFFVGIPFIKIYFFRIFHPLAFEILPDGFVYYQSSKGCTYKFQDLQGMKRYVTISPGGYSRKQANIAFILKNATVMNRINSNTDKAYIIPVYEFTKEHEKLFEKLLLVSSLKDMDPIINSSI